MTCSYTLSLECKEFRKYLIHEVPKHMPLEVLKSKLNEFDISVITGNERSLRYIANVWELLLWKDYKSRYFRLAEMYWLKNLAETKENVKRIVNLSIEVRKVVTTFQKESDNVSPERQMSKNENIFVLERFRSLKAKKKCMLMTKRENSLLCCKLKMGVLPVM